LKNKEKTENPLNSLAIKGFLTLPNDIFNAIINQTINIYELFLRNTKAQKGFKEVERLSEGI